MPVKSAWLDAARAAMHIESASIARAADRLDDSLIRAVDLILAHPNNLAPTASAVTALALGHALAIALMCARNFTAEEFGRFHPGGQLGRNLNLHVDTAMHTGDDVAFVAPET